MTTPPPTPTTYNLLPTTHNLLPTTLTPPERIAVVGLGYVGLPLAAVFARHLPVIGFDIDPGRVEELLRVHDRNCEVPPEALRSANLRFTTDPAGLREADFLIVAVSTPVDRAKRPDLSHLTEASWLVGRHLRRGATVVYESTVYPGCGPGPTSKWATRPSGSTPATRSTVWSTW